MKPRSKAISIGTPVRVVQLEHGRGMLLPAYQSAGAAGLDLMAAIEDSAVMTIKPGSWVLVPTGLALEIPPGFEAQVRPRSGLAMRHGITVLNSPGTIDADYRGEIKVLLINHGQAVFEIAREDRIAQLVLAPVARANLVVALELQVSHRGAEGFGSTGSKAANSMVREVRTGSAKSRTPKGKGAMIKSAIGGKTSAVANKIKDRATAKPTPKLKVKPKAKESKQGRISTRKTADQKAAQPAKRGRRSSRK